MTPQEFYAEGRLREAIVALGDELRKNPLDGKRRSFLFELLLFAGDFDRAEKQLVMLSGKQDKSAATVLLYRSALHAERTRQEMFLKNELPPLLEVIGAGGTCDGRAFAEFEDSDPRIGSNIEMFIAGSYAWIPVGYLRKLEIEPPTCLRDVMWARARVETTPDFRFQELGEVLLPMLAPLSSRHAEEPVKLGRECAWEPDERYGQVPFGAKLMVIDGEDVPFLNIRSVEWNPRGGEPFDASA